MRTRAERLITFQIKFVERGAPRLYAKALFSLEVKVTTEKNEKKFTIPEVAEILGLSGNNMLVFHFIFNGSLTVERPPDKISIEHWKTWRIGEESVIFLLKHMGKGTL